MVTFAQVYGALKPVLSAQEKKRINVWGKNFYKGIRQNQVLGHDGRASLAAGLTSWGAVSGDKRIYKKGVSYFKKGVKDILADGRERKFSRGEKGHAGLELKYEHSTYGQLSIAAYVIEKEGGSGFSYKGSGGTLIDGYNHLISRSFHPELRTKITHKQKDLDGVWKPNSSSRSFAFVEFARHFGYSAVQIPHLNEVLRVRGVKGRGFLALNHGGYTSCLFGK